MFFYSNQVFYIKFFILLFIPNFCFCTYFLHQNIFSKFRVKKSWDFSYKVYHIPSVWSTSPIRHIFGTVIFNTKKNFITKVKHELTRKQKHAHNKIDTQKRSRIKKVFSIFDWWHRWPWYLYSVTLWFAKWEKPCLVSYFVYSGQKDLCYT